jgi:hypothetical protein
VFYLSGRIARLTLPEGETLMFDLRQQCLEFAASYPTPNVRLAVQHAHTGNITWEQCYNLFRKAMGDALTEVAK